MSLAGTSYANRQDFYVPAFEVIVDTRKLDRAVVYDITSVTYQDNIKSMDSFNITVNNWDAAKRDFKYSDSRTFDPGQTVTLKMGYYNDLRLMLTGKITAMQPNFPSGGQPTLAVSGLNMLQDLRQKQGSYQYKDATDSEIAEQVAGRLGLPIKTRPLDNEEKYKYVLQNNQYDLVFLMERARKIGYDFFVQEELVAGLPHLFFGPSDRGTRKPFKLKYGASLIDFQPTLDTARQPEKVHVNSWDSVGKTPIRATITRDQLATNGVGTAGRQSDIDKAFKGREEVIANQPVNSVQEATTLGKQILEDIAKEMVTGAGSVVGLPDLRAGSIVFLEGLGKRFSGRYFVTSTTHTIGDSGYTTKFNCRREELKKG